MAQRFFDGALHAANYAKFRSRPPAIIADKIIAFLKEKYSGPLTLCVDVGCGSGQSTELFSPHFQKVLGTDVSEAQIKHAREGNFPENVKFEVSAAEKISLENESVQLVTASQACHWFDLPAFFVETNRVLCKNGTVALFCHNFPVVCHPPDKSQQLQSILDNLYKVKTAGYWGSGRAEVDNEYKNITIPYSSFVREEFWTDTCATSLQDFAGYLSTWSGIENYKKKHGEEAGNKLLEEFINSCLCVLQTNEDPKNVLLGTKRKYILLLGRKE